MRRLGEPPPAMVETDLQPGVLGNVREILVGGQHREVVADAKLRQKSIDRSDLHALSATVVPQLRRLDVIVAIRHDERQRGKGLDDLRPVLGPDEALQELLQNEAGRQKRFAALNGPR